ncbi:SGNH hydrolase-type esterase domain-containing protein [Apiospora arundinis]
MVQRRNRIRIYRAIVLIAKSSNPTGWPASLSFVLFAVPIPILTLLSIYIYIYMYYYSGFRPDGLAPMMSASSSTHPYPSPFSTPLSFVIPCVLTPAQATPLTAKESQSSVRSAATAEQLPVSNAPNVALGFSAEEPAPTTALLVTKTRATVTVCSMSQ